MEILGFKIDAGLAGAAVGAVVGGPAGALTGYQVGSSLEKGGGGTGPDAIFAPFQELFGQVNHGRDPRQDDGVTVRRHRGDGVHRHRRDDGVTVRRRREDGVHHQRQDDQGIHRCRPEHRVHDDRQNYTVTVRDHRDQRHCATRPPTFSTAYDVDRVDRSNEFSFLDRLLEDAERLMNSDKPSDQTKALAAMNKFNLAMQTISTFLKAKHDAASSTLSRLPGAR